ncbi:putative digestive organ expansion factor, predicted [Plasmopara halstedii]
MGVRKGGKKKGSRKRKTNVWDDEKPIDKRDRSLSDGQVKKRRNGSMMGQWKAQKIAKCVKVRQFVNSVHEKKQWQREKYNETWEDTVNAIYKEKCVEEEQKSVREETQSDDNTSDSASDSEKDFGKTKSVFQKFVDTFKPIQEDRSEEFVQENEENSVEAQDEVVNLRDDEQIAAMEKDDEEQLIEQEEEEDPYRLRYILSFLTEDEAKTFNAQKKSFSKVTLPEMQELFDVSYKSGVDGRTDLVMTPESADRKKQFVRSRLLTTWKQRKVDADTKYAKGSVQRALLQQMFAYKDVLFAGQSYEITDSLRHISAMHVLNHVFKARDTILRNNERLKKRECDDSNEDEKEYRDQGFCRANVLVLLPLRSAAVAFVNHLLALLPSTMTTFHNKDRFDREFGHTTIFDELSLDDGKKEWQRVFESGNNDDCFQLGLSFSRKAVRFYSGYHYADVILASPLGLRQQLGDEAATLDNVKNLSTDFLSSIEVCIVDSASLMMMQNLDHVRTVLQATNLPPKEAPHADFSRLREWNLTFLASYFRQTIVFAHGLEPALNALVNKTCRNLSGVVKFVRRYDAHDGSASIVRVVPQIKQIFQRVDLDCHGSLSAADEVELRFAFFKKHIFEPLLDQPRKHVLIFIPSYFDYVRIRNLFHDSMNKKLIRSVQCCEYTKSTQVSRARTTFFHGHCHVMLYTERFHFYHQYQMRGVHHIIWYGPPAICDFYPEMMNMLANNDIKDDEIGESKGDKTSIALITRLDLLRMQRIVGNKRADRMCRPKAAKPTFLFY